jgi:hypothetical protein
MGAEMQLRRAPTTLDRFFDGAGRLLYVGITGELPTQLTTHDRRRPWWTDVRRLVLEHFPTRAAARAAEAAVIRDEAPRFNRWQDRRSIPVEVAEALRAIAERERRDWRAGECAHRCADGCVYQLDAFAPDDRRRFDPDSVDCTLLDQARDGQEAWA